MGKHDMNPGPCKSLLSTTPFIRGFSAKEPRNRSALRQPEVRITAAALLRSKGLQGLGQRNSLHERVDKKAVVVQPIRSLSARPSRGRQTRTADPVGNGEPICEHTTGICGALPVRRK